MAQVIWRGWNGLWGNWNRHWAWLELLDDGRYQVRWRGGDWTDRDGSLRTGDSVAAVDALCELLNGDEVGEWREIRVKD